MRGTCVMFVRIKPIHESGLLRRSSEMKRSNRRHTWRPCSGSSTCSSRAQPSELRVRLASTMHGSSTKRLSLSYRSRDCETSQNLIDGQICALRVRALGSVRTKIDSTRRSIMPGVLTSASDTSSSWLMFTNSE